MVGPYDAVERPTIGITLSYDFQRALLLEVDNSMLMPTLQLGGIVVGGAD